MHRQTFIVRLSIRVYRRSSPFIRPASGSFVDRVQGIKRRGFSRGKSGETPRGAGDEGDLGLYSVSNGANPP